LLKEKGAKDIPLTTPVAESAAKPAPKKPAGSKHGM